MGLKPLALALGLTLGSSAAFAPVAAHDNQGCAFPPPDVLASVHRVYSGQPGYPAGRSIGSAVHTRSHGWVTAKHVLEGDHSRHISGEAPTRVLTKQNRVTSWKGDDRDGARFTTNAQPRGSVQIARNPPRRGEEVWSVGYPKGDVLIATRGHYMSVEMQEGYLTHTAKGAGGMSGGALFVCREVGWRLIGVNTAVMLVATPKTRMGRFPVPSSVVSYGTSISSILSIR